MRQPPHRKTWWPASVAGLLILLTANLLGRSLLPAPLPVLPVATAPEVKLLTTTALQNGEKVAADTISATALLATAAEAELPQELQKIPVDTTIRFATYSPLEDDTLAQPRTYRRYLGALDGQAIVVHLSIQDNLQVKSYREYLAGSWYYRYARQPAEHRLLFRRQHGAQLVLAEEAPDKASAADTAHMEWRFDWPLGRNLQGQRRAVYNSKQQTIQLHEDYSQATPYELLRLTAQRRYWCEESESVKTYYSTDFLHLLGADSLRLGRWQAPPPGARRDSLRRWLRSEACQQVSQSLNVKLNDFSLFSYSMWTNSYYYGAHPEHSIEGFIVDLRTGKELLIDKLLRSGTEPALLKLLAKHLRQDYPEMNEGDNWHWKKVPPMPDSFTLTPGGLQAEYGDYALAAYVAHGANTTTIPYRELRPLVRPGTPLARMLQVRGLW
ncbi:hypothetical protein LRS06_18280 [Hymenobacter sp. J193]|uniref:hypothetical protein n=1 Tax=Hymenobacter sp. J193 TaxID=2898429 RepID=UPI002150F739|nr:hypothetical protein [Hymenobacter sp. J193]MCR5889684.1 hypothetical protein [Hymenobacter sp. J193]